MSDSYSKSVASRRGLILHVDDDEDVRATIATVLEFGHFKVCEAASGAAALAQARQLRGKLDVLIVDFHLDNDMTGTEVAEEIARVLGYSLPTIILTGDPANAEIPWLSNAPVWLARKPLDPEILLRALPALVSFRRAMRKFQPGQVFRRDPAAIAAAIGR